ncbi:GGDEF domain-containing protein [Inhella proteolytica]|uniref:diguanylate cyclase n=1 Tax=Inhella proteolytica TaxID=2795029 RepID=A0A931J6E3_9BURK|nr:GGDEF domain-containing protein [Inhella proteolytica]MBH9579085.1 GGDEF domain-containing protein [Inhella proteolytica]
MAANPVPAMLWLVAFQIGLHALAWLVAARLLREERRALLNWAGFNALLAIGLVLCGMRDGERGWWVYNGVNLITLLAFGLMRRGVELFLRSGRSDLQQALQLAPWVLPLLLLPPTTDWAAWRVLAAFGGQAFVMAVTAWSLARPMHREFGRWAQLGLVLPTAVIAGLNASAALRQVAAWPVPQEIQLGTDFNQGLLYAYLAGTACFGVGFLAVVTQRLTHRLREASQRDALTGLLNRRALSEYLEAQWHRHLRRRYPLALVMVDLDHFKLVNDSNGHAAGDAVLRRTAELFRQHLRREDLVGRMGGEEFLLVLPDTPKDAALALAERLRQLAHAQALGVSMSLGLTMASADDGTAEEAVKRADAALYRAKAQGRDRVVCIEPPPGG